MNRFAPLLLVALALTLLFLTVAGEHGLLYLLQLKQEEQAFEQKNRLIESEIASVHNKVYGIRQDPEYLEKAAREQLGLSKPGEIIYLFPESEQQ